MSLQTCTIVLGMRTIVLSKMMNMAKRRKEFEEMKRSRLKRNLRSRLESQQEEISRLEMEVKEMEREMKEMEWKVKQR